jgi:cytosine/adenosine deaminase-related metal-dependent hydrolase
MAIRTTQRKHGGRAASRGAPSAIGAESATGRRRCVQWRQRSVTAREAAMGEAVAIRGGTVVTMDARRTVARRDLLVGPDGRIAALVEPGSPLPAERLIDAGGRVIVPGLVQAHLHLCQTLFRGLGERLTLLDWLRQRIWPLEAAHTPASLRASARLGIAELLLGGTTAALDMGTVHHTDVLFEVAAETGLRYTGGKAMMDAGAGVPPGLLEATAVSVRESDRLAARWHGAAGGRLRYAYCPRFILSCTPTLLRAVAARARADGLLVHTHASEQRPEVEAVRQQFGAGNIRALADLGIAGPQAVLAHCVWPDPHEIDLLARDRTHVAHCPSCNLKLGSGIAPIADYVARGINVGIGADGAAANNRLDGWEELRLAGLLASWRASPAALSARQLFELATLGGARALGLEREIGSLEPGKWADLAIVDLRAPHALGPEDVYTQLVYSARADDVRTVLVAGQALVEERRLTGLDLTDILLDAEAQRAELLQRAGLNPA